MATGPTSNLQPLSPRPDRRQRAELELSAGPHRGSAEHLPTRVVVRDVPNGQPCRSHLEWENPAIAGLSVSRSVSGILSGAVIHLGRPFPVGSSRLPGARRAASSLRLALHRVGLAQPPTSPRMLVVSYTTVSPLPPAPRRRVGGLLSVALSIGFPRPGFLRHPRPLVSRLSSTAEAAATA